MEVQNKSKLRDIEADIEVRDLIKESVPTLADVFISGHNPSGTSLSEKYHFFIIDVFY